MYRDCTTSPNKERGDISKQRTIGTGAIKRVQGNLCHSANGRSTRVKHPLLAANILHS